MTRAENSGYGIVRSDDKYSAVRQDQEGVIIVTDEERVAKWLRELVALA